MFNDLKKDAAIDAEEAKVPASIPRGPLDTDIYDGVVDVAYMTKSDGGAEGVVLSVELDNGRTYRSTLWVKSKKGEHIWRKGDNTGYLPGFSRFEELSYACTGKGMVDLPEPETRVLNIYDPAAGKEKPTEVDVIMALQGARIKLAIEKRMEDAYPEDSQWQIGNEVVRILNDKGQIYQEVEAGADTTEWMDAFNKLRLESDGSARVYDRRKKSKNGEAKVRGGGGTGSKADDTPSLFA